MNAIKGRWEKGQIVLDSPTDWPEGCRLVVEPLPAEEQYGLTEEEWPRDPEAIAEWIKWFDSFEPVEFTQDEEADLASWRQQVKDYTVEKMTQRIEDLFP